MIKKINASSHFHLSKYKPISILWYALCFTCLKDNTMTVTSTSQTQYVRQTSNTTNATRQEYKSSNTIPQQKSNENKWINELNKDINNILNNTSSATSVNLQSSLIKEEIEEKINQYAQILMKESGDTSESELETSKLLNEYKKELLQEYKASIEDSTDTVMSTQQQAVIQVLMQENTQETSVLTALLATKSGAVKETQEITRIDEMKEKYKDIYTPIPETYSKADEDLQIKKVYEAYPNYMSLQELWDKQQSFYKGEPNKLGSTQTEEQEKYQKIASESMTGWINQKYGSLKGLNEMVSGSQGVKDKYPVNLMAKDGDIKNAKELTRFTNAAIYEGLESGKTLFEAKKDAGMSRTVWMDEQAATRKTDGAFNKSGTLYSPSGKSFLQEWNDERDVNWKMNSTWDLRAYGIDDKWEWHEIYENQDKMISEIKKEINEYNFMLNNRGLMENANNKLDPNYRDRINFYEKQINNEYMPKAELALKVFENYKIYD